MDLTKTTAAVTKWDKTLQPQAIWASQNWCGPSWPLAQPLGEHWSHWLLVTNSDLIFQSRTSEVPARTTCIQHQVTTALQDITDIRRERRKCSCQIDKENTSAASGWSHTAAREARRWVSRSRGERCCSCTPQTVTPITRRHDLCASWKHRPAPGEMLGRECSLLLLHTLSALIWPHVSALVLSGSTKKHDIFRVFHSRNSGGSRQQQNTSFLQSQLIHPMLRATKGSGTILYLLNRKTRQAYELWFQSKSSCIKPWTFSLHIPRPAQGEAGCQPGWPPAILLHRRCCWGWVCFSNAAGKLGAKYWAKTKPEITKRPTLPSWEIFSRGYF